ncbi:hypothetical protein G6F57_006697 [Rhizopus arrhizus]|nr:hypothetical protein G6F23_004222 [Rhizopus arrhizus]KAG1423291.1 hypothetical protein G6F58_002876 [Rhizopus delemar]KAG0767895.1 hypothetical protein G6F24_002406 [Rhizopus arrhizus]KAG0789582.1 hypothetical protein G6F21_006412 [Rhizopus arrhizus]KAG0800304.1 hypothetical protein G6F22_002365 [Rhizopus arrhizus]
MNPEIDEKLGQIIKQITESGEWTLDEKKLKLIKSTCKRSDHYVNVTFEHVMAQLQKNHSQIRYSSLQLIEQLFERSKLFRELLTEDFPLFIQQVVGIQNTELPPPVSVAAKLKQYALALIKNWYIKYGEKYRQIGISFDFLLDNGFMDDNQVSSSLSSIHSDNINKANKSARMKAIHLNRYELLKADIDDHLEIIQSNLDTMDGCFDILVPKNIGDDDQIDFDALLRGEPIPKQPMASNYKDDIMSHGLGSSRYKITIDLSEASLMDDVKETEENSVLFDQLREAFTVLQTKHVKQVNDWINALIKIDINDKAEKENLVKRLIDIKSRMAESSRKAKLLNVQVSQRKVDPNENVPDDIEGEDEEFEDEEFEEVDINKERKSNRKYSSRQLPPLQRIFPLSSDPRMSEDPTYSGPLQIKETEQVEQFNYKGKQKADATREELLKVAPVVEWGDDLYYWDKDHVQFNTSGIERSHRFMGVGEGANEIPDHLLNDLRKRPVYYKRQLPNEIPVGRPLDSSVETINRQAGSSKGQGVSNGKDNPVMDNLWELLEADVMSQTGQQRITLNKKRQKKPVEKSSLIDIKKKPNDSYARLQRKMNSSKNKKLIDEAVEFEREMKQRNREANSWQ